MTRAYIPPACYHALRQMVVGASTCLELCKESPIKHHIHSSHKNRQSKADSPPHFLDGVESIQTKPMPAQEPAQTASAPSTPCRFDARLISVQGFCCQQSFWLRTTALSTRVLSGFGACCDFVPCPGFHRARLCSAPPEVRTLSKFTTVPRKNLEASELRYGVDEGTGWPDSLLQLHSLARPTRVGPFPFATYARFGNHQATASARCRNSPATMLWKEKPRRAIATGLSAKCQCRGGNRTPMKIFVDGISSPTSDSGYVWMLAVRPKLPPCFLTVKSPTLEPVVSAKLPVGPVEQGNLL